MMLYCDSFRAGVVFLFLTACACTITSHAALGEGYLEIKSVILTPEQAEDLVSRWQDKQPELIFRELMSLEPETAKRLARHRGTLTFSSLVTLSEQAADELASYKGNCMRFDSLRTVSPRVALSLAEHHGKRLDLSALTSISVEVAAALATFDGELGLYGLAEIPPDVAKAFAEHSGFLNLNGLRAVSGDTAHWLAQHNGDLGLLKVATISTNAADSLAQFRHKLNMTDLTEMASPQLAAKLIESGNNSFPNLTILSLDAARVFAKSKGSLNLDGLPTLTDECAEALAQFRGDYLSLNGITTLSDKAVDYFRQAEGRHRNGQFRFQIRNFFDRIYP